MLGTSRDIFTISRLPFVSPVLLLASKPWPGDKTSESSGPVRCAAWQVINLPFGIGCRASRFGALRRFGQLVCVCGRGGDGAGDGKDGGRQGMRGVKAGKRKPGKEGKAESDAELENGRETG